MDAMSEHEFCCRYKIRDCTHRGFNFFDRYCFKSILVSTERYSAGEASILGLFVFSPGFWSDPKKGDSTECPQ